MRSPRWRWTSWRCWALGWVVLATLVGALSLASSVHPADDMGFTHHGQVCSEAHASEADASEPELCRFSQALWRHVQALRPPVPALMLPFADDWREGPHLRPPIARG